MKNMIRSGIAAVVLACATSGSARADAVTDWNAYWEQAVFATKQPVPAQARFGAILHTAIFDAVNGIERKFQPYLVDENAPPGARAEAAAVQAAYTVLAALYPAEANTLKEHLAASLASIPGSAGKSKSIERGLAWGEYVARRILEDREFDGWPATPPPYFGSSATGIWRSIEVPGQPDGTLPAVFTQLASMTPFVLEMPWQFRPGPPYAPTLSEALASAQYAADLNEVKSLGRINSTTRSQNETHLALLWQAMGPIDLNRAARSVVPAGNGLVENARLFALANMATADALITSMESKFVYGLWRPHHAIRLAGDDGNPATEADPEWSGLFVAPRFPDYISNHSCLTGAFMQVLTRMLGDAHAFTLSSPNYPNFTWSYSKFSEAAEQVKRARVWAGIHFRTACDVGEATGRAVADYTLETVLRPAR